MPRTDIPAPAECAAWLGIPPDQLENLIEHPSVARALFQVRTIYEQWHEGDDFDTTMRHSGLRPEQIFAQQDLPVVDPDGLDVNKLRLELDLMRGAEGAKPERQMYGLTHGRMMKAENRVSELRKRTEQAINLLEGAHKEIETDKGFTATVQGKTILRDNIEKRIEQAMQCLKDGLEKTGGN